MGVGNRNGTHLSRATPNKWVFRDRLTARIGTMLMALVFTLGPLMMAGPDWSATLLFFLLWLPFAGVWLYLSGPRELRLDLIERTYQKVSGWPLSPETRRGPWEDLWGVYVGRGGSSSYLVGVRGARFGKRMDLGRFSDQAPAEGFADELATLMGLPRVPPPKPLFEPRKSGIQPQVTSRPKRFLGR